MATVQGLRFEWGFYALSASKAIFKCPRFKKGFYHIDPTLFNYVSPRRGTRFVLLALSPSRPLALAPSLPLPLLSLSWVGHFSLGARVCLITGMVRLTLSRWRPIKEKLRVPFFSKCRNFVNNSRNCTKFEAQGDHGCPFDF